MITEMTSNAKYEYEMGDRIKIEKIYFSLCCVYS